MRNKHRTPWWIDPANFVIFITLPLFLVSSLYSKEITDSYGFANFVTNNVIWLGIGCLALIVFGCYTGGYLATKFQPKIAANEQRYIIAIRTLTIASIIAHTLLIGDILLNYQLVLAALQGSRGAIYAVKDHIVKIEGVTSFTQMYLISFPLTAAYSHIFKKPISRNLKHLTIVLFCLITIRGFVTLERLAIIEAILILVIATLGYKERIPRWVGILPAIGFIGVYFLFAAGEYTRSWPYYEQQYSSFWDFVNIRLFGYIQLATNNGAGVLELSGPVNFPYFTAGWFRKLPIWDTIHGPLGTNPLDVVFHLYGSAEFNNPGGIFAGIIDYGEFSVIYYLILGGVSGFLFTNFKRKGIFSLVYFPAWFLGFPVLTQAVYWGDPRFFLVTLLSPLVATYISSKKISKSEHPCGTKFTP